jgi:predicted Zn-dependent protease
VSTLLDFNFEGPKWPSGQITWSFATFNFAADAANAFSSSMSADYQAVVERAIQKWASVSGLAFQQVVDSSTTDIRIGFGILNTATSHVIGQANTKSSGSLFVPDAIVRLEDPSQLPVVADAQRGLVYQDRITTIYQDVLHEFGHSLGLGHSLDPTAIMYPVLGDTNPDISASDINGINLLYLSETVPITRNTLGPLPVFRFFDTHDGGHFFTTSMTECENVLATRMDMNFEGVGCNSVNPVSNDPNAAPVYRFFDTHDGGHFFTTSTAERDQVQMTRADMHFEGVGYSEHTSQQAGDAPVYRFFETTSGGHFFTASAAERDAVQATRSDMRFEGIAFFAPA